MTSRQRRLFLLCLSAASLAWGPSTGAAEFPEPILLWPKGAPGAQGTEEVDQPTIRLYRPAPVGSVQNRSTTNTPSGTGQPSPRAQAATAAPNGAAVLICPGGGYGALATDHEGHQLALWFNRIGVTAAVLKYRLGPRYHHPAPLQDAQRGLRFLRSQAADLQLSSDRIGVMGFSAGGHLASTLSTHYDAGDAASDDPIERVSCRPDFTVLGYPVISLSADYAHRGSGKNLLGENPDPELLKSLSNETQVTADTPPAFLFQTNEDAGVPAENALHYVLALRKHGVPCELHLYQHGPHGVGMGVGDPVLASWMDRLHDWLKTNGWLTTAARAEVTGAVTVDGEPLRWGTITFIPEGDDHLPVAWSMVGRGKYTVPAGRGVVVGTSRVVINSLGDVVPRPTIADITELAGDFTATIQPGTNTLDFNVTTKK